MLEMIDLSKCPWQVAVAQRQGDRELSAQLKIAHASADRLVAYTHYDAGLVVEPHRHGGVEVIFVLEGSMTVDGAECPAGTVIVLDEASTFGPIVAGAEGTVLLEVFQGTDSWLPREAEPSEAYARLVRERRLVRLPEDDRS